MKKSQKKLLIIALFSSVFFLSCEKKQSLLKLNVLAKTHQGEVISQASVYIDGKNVGETDAKGTFATEMSAEKGSRPKVEVRKESDTYYFAPFIDSILISGEDVHQASLKATLYFVPKPKPVSADIEKDPVSHSVASTGGGPDENQVMSAQASQEILSEQDVPVEPIKDSSEKSDDEGAVFSSESKDVPANKKQDVVVNQPISNRLPVATKALDLVQHSAPNSDTKARQVDELAAKLVEKTNLDDPKDPESSGSREEASLDGQTVATPINDSSELISTADTDRQIDASEDANTANTKSNLQSDQKQDSSGDLSIVSGQTNDEAIKGPAILTVNVASLVGKAEVGISGVDVLYAEAKAKSYKKGCTTNDRGRCVIRFPNSGDSPTSIMATKKGFKTVTANVVVRHQTKYKIIMDRGLTLDIHALTRVYNHVEGLPQVDVFVENKKVGVTDKLGHFSYVFSGKREALLSVTLKAQGYLPEVYETDFVASGPMSLVKYFAPPVPPSALVALAPPMPAGNIDQLGIAQLSGPLQDAVKVSVRKHFFSTAAFREAPVSLVERAAKSTRSDFLELKRKGWSNTPLKSQLDALMVPTVIMGAKPAIEISLIDNSGTVMAAAREEIDSSMEFPSIDRAIYVVAQKIVKSFPFEGAVTSKDGDLVAINIGHAQGRGVKAGDLVDVYGVQVGRFGDKEKHKKIATLTLREVFDGQSKGSLSWMAPRAMIDRGDLVVLRPRRTSDVSSAQIHVVSRDGGKTTDVAQANVYLNGHWIGTTDESGRLYTDGSGNGTLRIVKQGFREQALDTKLAPKSRLDVVLTREVAFIKIESKPSGAMVFVEGKSLGRTPLISPIAVPSGFIRIKVENGSGYKPYTTVLELDEGTLDLTGSRAIQLESDFLAQASRLKKAGKNQEAAQLLGNVPPTHSDYLMARFEAGEMWLSVLDNPAKAESFFAEVLADESVKSFGDKRFIGAHINAAIAQFRVAESLQSQDGTNSRQYYQKVVEGLDAVLPHVRHVPGEQYNQAVHTVDYYRALARHRLWVLSQDPQMLTETVKTWRYYLEGDAKALPPEGGSKALLQNAEVYFKQALASLEVSKKSLQQ